MRAGIGKPLLRVQGSIVAIEAAVSTCAALTTLPVPPAPRVIAVNVSVSVAIYPLQALPHVYRYGYAFPFYNISRAVRAIVFRTKNEGAFLSASLPPYVSLLIIQIVIRF